MLPTIFASTRKVPRVIPLLNLHSQTTFPLSVRLYSPPGHKKRKGEYAGSQIVAFVAGMTRRIRLANRRKWSLVMNVVVVVGFFGDCTPPGLLTYARPSSLHGSWFCCRSCAFLSLEVRRMQDVRDLSGKGRRCMPPFSTRLLLIDFFCERLVSSSVILVTEGGIWTACLHLCKIRLRASGIVHPAHIIHLASVKQYRKHLWGRNPRKLNIFASRQLLRRLVQKSSSRDPPGGASAERSHQTCQTVIPTCRSHPIYLEDVCVS